MDWRAFRRRYLIGNGAQGKEIEDRYQDFALDNFVNDGGSNQNRKFQNGSKSAERSRILFGLVDVDSGSVTKYGLTVLVILTLP